MSKADDQILWRDQGLALAIRIAESTEKDGGRVSSALKKELRFRRASGVNSTMTKKELERACDMIKSYTIQAVCAMAMLILWEQFGFGQKRLSQFMREFMVHTEALVKGEIDWLDITDSLKATTGIELEMPEELLRMRKEGASA